MGLESTTYIDGLVGTNPISGDPKSQGDDHLRLIKTVLKNTFPQAGKPFTFPSSEEKSADYAVVAADDNVFFMGDATSAEVTLTLPVLTAAQKGWSMSAVKIDTSINHVAIAPPSGTINGLAEVLLHNQFESAKILWDGSEFYAFLDSAPPLFRFVEKTSSATLTPNELRGLVNAAPSGATITISLPAAHEGEWVYVRLSGAGKTLTIDPAGSETVDGALTYVTSTDGEVLLLIAQAGAWEISSTYNPKLQLAGKANIQTKTAGFVIAATDFGVLFRANSGSDITGSLPALANVREGDLFHFQNDAGGNLILDGDGSETIDLGLTTIIGPGERATISKVGSTWIYTKRPKMRFTLQDVRAAGVDSQGVTTSFAKWTLGATLEATVAGASVADSVVSLPPGIYNVEGWIATFSGAANPWKARVRNTTDGTTLAVSSGTDRGSGFSDSPLLINDKFALTVTKNIELQMRGGTGPIGATDVGEEELYASITFERIG